MEVGGSGRVGSGLGSDRRSRGLAFRKVAISETKTEGEVSERVCTSRREKKEEKE